MNLSLRRPARWMTPIAAGAIASMVAVAVPSVTTASATTVGTGACASTIGGNLNTWDATEQAVNPASGLTETACKLAFIGGAGTWTVPTGVTSVFVEMVGGGGGGGNMAGGGAGEVVLKNGETVNGSAMPAFTVTAGAELGVTVGSGGAGGTEVTAAVNGEDTTFASLTALGGGGGASSTRLQKGTNGSDGGSGGGGAPQGGPGFPFDVGLGGSGVGPEGFGWSGSTGFERTVVTSGWDFDAFVGGGGGGAADDALDGEISGGPFEDPSVTTGTVSLVGGVGGPGLPFRWTPGLVGVPNDEFGRGGDGSTRFTAEFGADQSVTMDAGQAGSFENTTGTPVTTDAVSPPRNSGWGGNGGGTFTVGDAAGTPGTAGASGVVILVWFPIGGGETTTTVPATTTLPTTTAPPTTNVPMTTVSPSGPSNRDGFAANDPDQSVRPIFAG